MSRGRVAGAARVSVVVGLLVAIVLAVATRPATAADRTVTLSTSTAKVGDTILVTIDGWPISPVIVSVCGNNAARGAQDCDLVSAVGLSADPNHPSSRQLVVPAPPTTCPCVVRAATSNNDLVTTTPIDIQDMPTGPVIPSASGALNTVRASARVLGGDPSIADWFRSALGGPTHMTLEVTLHNDGETPVSGLTMTAAVGRDGQSGEPLPPVAIETLGPGETRPYTVPVTLGPPAFGSYEVTGTVYSPTGVIPFSATTKTTPWLLILFGIVLAIDIVWLIARSRSRSRSQREYPPRAVPEPQAVRAQVPALAAAPEPARVPAAAASAAPANAGEGQGEPSVNTV
jgi:hypothetical protein